MVHSGLFNLCSALESCIENPWANLSVLTRRPEPRPSENVGLVKAARVVPVPIRMRPGGVSVLSKLVTGQLRTQLLAAGATVDEVGPGFLRSQQCPIF